MRHVFLSRRASICVILSLLAWLSAAARAEGTNIGIDVGAIAREIKEFVIYVLEQRKINDDLRLKNSVASVSARMSRMAGIKRSFADFLTDKPNKLHDFPPQALREANRQLKQIDRELKGLEKDLERMEPTWAANHPKLHEQLFAIGHGKGLQWRAEYGPHGDGVDISRLRDWMIGEAAKLEDAASEIKTKLDQALREG
jgi:hypothetical protein